MITSLIVIFQMLYFTYCLHYFQWKSYYIKRYLKYLFKNKLIIILNTVLIVQIILNILEISNIYVFNLIFLFFNIFILFLFLIKPKKIKFIFTKRILRLFILSLIILFPFYFTKKYLLLTTLTLTPLVLAFADLIDAYKYIEHYKYLTRAITKLSSNKNLITIGITGSNGKTSVKEILKQLLETKFNVITTSKNQNTPKGAMIAINNKLTPKTDIFICEMGARAKGDILEMCNLVNPSKAIITSISPQHLETFKTEQNIYLTKKELPNYIKEGYCVYNLDNNLSHQMYNEKSGEKSGISTTTKSHLYASNIHINNYKTYFDINYNDKTYPCHTKLLGKHNVTNILLALDMALHLGIEIQQAIQVILNLNPTPHRLEYIKTHIDIIDDSYNCSLDSARVALKVLGQCNKIKVICTPGIIEGGKKQFELNQQLSANLNYIADVLILVGKTNRNALISRLTSFELFYTTSNTLLSKIFKRKLSTKIARTNVPKIKIDDISSTTKKRAYIVNSLKDAKLIFKKLLNNTHILLLLNDLPDEYN